MPMKHYKISEFAAMVGLPQSKIRFYEKYGLFHVKRNENGYRYYTPEDAFRVNAFRTLLLYGFTVECAIQMLNEQQSGDVFLHSLERQQTFLQHEVLLLNYRLKRLNDMISLIESEPCSSFHVTDTEDYLYVRASYGRDFSISVENHDLITQFADLLSITSYARIIPHLDFQNFEGSVNPSYISAIPLSEAHRLSDPHDPRIGRLKLGKCIRFQRYATRAQSVLKFTFADAFSYMEEHGYRLRDDLVIFPSFLNLDGKGQDVETIFIPVK